MSSIPPMDSGRDKLLLAAAREQCWGPAIDLLRSFRGEPAASLVTTPSIGEAFVRLVTEAPDEVVAQTRSALDMKSFVKQPLGFFRRAAVAWLSQVHLDRAETQINAGNHALAFHHTAEAIRVVPRSREHETIMSCGVAFFIGHIGRVEARHAAERPDLDIDPGLVAPEATFVRNLPDVEGYDPEHVAALVVAGINAGCSKAFVVSALQLALEEAHWPTWRRLLVSAQRYSKQFKAAASLIEAEPLPLSTGTKAYLRALVDGFRPTEEDDIPF